MLSTFSKIAFCKMKLLSIFVLSRWLPKEHDIMEDAALNQRKHFRKGRRAVNHVELNKQHFEKFKTGRKKEIE